MTTSLRGPRRGGVREITAAHVAHVLRCVLTAPNSNASAPASATWLRLRFGDGAPTPGALRRLLDACSTGAPPALTVSGRNKDKRYAFYRVTDTPEHESIARKANAAAPCVSIRRRPG